MVIEKDSIGEEWRYTTTQGDYGAADLVTTVPAQFLLTNDGGEGARLRVDVAQTGFFSGREFRTFRRLSLGNGATDVIRATVGTDIVLFGVELTVTDGWLDMETRAGGTEGGTFSTSVPIFNANNMSDAPSYVSQATLDTGGTHTGGTVLDVLVAKTSGATAQAVSVGSTDTDERGVGAGVYYFAIENLNNGVSEGYLKFRWEER